MAQVKNYGLSGVHRTLQLGKQGPILVGNADTDSFVVTLQDAETLTTMSGANATNAQNFVTKSQLDVVYTEAQFLANVNYNDSSPILLGNISAGVKTIITTFEVDTVFDGNTTVTIGTGDDNSLLMSDSYAEIEVTGSYQTTGLFEFAADTSLNIYVTQWGATQGAGKILVSVVDGPVVDGGTINYGGAGGGADLGDLAVTGATLGLANDASETTIVVGSAAGGLLVNPDSSLTVAKLYANSTSQDYFSQGGDYTSGTYTAGGGGGVISLTGATNVVNYLNSLQYTIVSLEINGGSPIPFSGGGWGGTSVTLNTSTAPGVDPTTVNDIVFNTIYQNRLVFDVDEGDYGLFIGDHNFYIQSIRDVRIEAGDDFSIISNDIFDLQSRSTQAGDGIRIITDDLNAGHTWLFENNGVLKLPAGGDIVDSNGTSVLDAPTAVSELTNDAGYIVSDTTGITGADQVTNMVTLTQAEYDAITPNASTVYFIVG